MTHSETDRGDLEEQQAGKWAGILTDPTNHIQTP